MVTANRNEESAALDEKYAGVARCDPLLLMPGHKLSRMIKEGALSSARLCQAYIERIKQVQPKINCMAEARFEEALREARDLDQLVRRFRESAAGADSRHFSPEELGKLDSPLFGVPLSVKESVGVKGMVNSCGVWDRRETRAERDAVVVANVRHLGMIPICTTNIPELTLFWADCQNPVYGRARNPYDQSRVTGASSGGEAGLIGAAGSLLGIGSDIGGSLRSPAHYCGIFSHKPSPFLVSPVGNWPEVKEARLRMFTLGPMCRYASDLRHLLRLLLSDVNNPLQDSYKTHQPADIGEQRRRMVKLLSEEAQSVDLGKLKLFYCDYQKINKLRALFGERESCVQSEIRLAQREVLDHFAAKFNCQLQQIDLEKHMENMFKIWHSLLLCGATVDRDEAYDEEEVERLFGIKNMAWELLKYTLGASRHSKEALLIMMFGLPVPKNRQRAYAYCEKFEKVARDIRADLDAKLGDNGVLVLPTLPTVALRHNVSLLKTNETRFPCLLNVLQYPATHATIRLSKKHKLPYGLTLASRPFNDHLTIAMAEEIEATFGGWTLPSGLMPSGSEKHRAEGKKLKTKAKVAPEEMTSGQAFRATNVDLAEKAA